jgi:hypothetical protein
MANCFENIIGIKAQCSGADTDSLSGYFITDYPGITIQTASQYNDEKTITGYNYLVDIRRRAMMRLNNDIQAYIASNYRVNSIPANTWSTGEFKSTVIPSGTSGERRGIVIYKQKPNCRFRKIELSRVRIYSNFTGTTNLKIADTFGVEYNPTINLIAGQINEFQLNITIKGSEVQVTLPSEISVYSNEPNCGVGCGNTKKNECVRTAGLNNGVANTSQAYGIELDVICKCDLSDLICDLATNNLIGQAAFELCGAMFYDEILMNNRLNYLTIYKEEKIKAQAQAAFDAYNSYMTNAMLGLRNFLVQNDGGCKCVDCSGVQKKSNV